MTDTLRPKLPDPLTIPPQAVREWTQIPLGQTLSVDITRSTIDHLFFALRRMAESQATFQQCLINYSHGQLERADDLLTQSQVTLRESENHLTQFVTDIMLSATRGRK
jgi:hypothetical protein